MHPPLSLRPSLRGQALLRTLTCTAAALLPLAVLRPIWSPWVQDPEPERPLPARTAFLEAERARLEEQIQGVWLQIGFETPQEFIEPRDFDGYASFQDGYMMLVLRDREPIGGFLRDPRMVDAVQGGAYRYRISSGLTLQAATLLGYATQEGELVVELAGDAREYDVLLDDEELVLSQPGGNRLTFRRLGEGDFPESVIRRLEQSREGYAPRPEDDGWNREGRR